MEPSPQLTNTIFYEAALLAEGVLKFEHPISQEQHQFLTRVASTLMTHLAQASVPAA